MIQNLLARRSRDGLQIEAFGGGGGRGNRGGNPWLRAAEPGNEMRHYSEHRDTPSPKNPSHRALNTWC